MEGYTGMKDLPMNSTEIKNFIFLLLLTGILFL